MLSGPERAIEEAFKVEMDREGGPSSDLSTAFFPPRKGCSRSQPIEEVLDVRHVPSSASRGPDPAIVERRRETAKVANT